MVDFPKLSCPSAISKIVRKLVRSEPCVARSRLRLVSSSSMGGRTFWKLRQMAGKNVPPPVGRQDGQGRSSAEWRGSTLGAVAVPRISWWSCRPVGCGASIPGSAPSCADHCNTRGLTLKQSAECRFNERVRVGELLPNCFAEEGAPCVSVIYSFLTAMRLHVGMIERLVHAADFNARWRCDRGPGRAKSPPRGSDGHSPTPTVTIGHPCWRSLT